MGMVVFSIDKHYGYLQSLRQRHFYHVVTQSPWPLCVSVHVCALVVSFSSYIHFYKFSGIFFLWSFFNLVGSMSFWFRDVVREGTFEGMHTKKVQKNLKFGFSLFITTEIMFFFAFFWAYFHSSLSPAVEIGCIWPPYGIDPIKPWKLPLLNTCLLLESGIFITICHMYMRGMIAIETFRFFSFTLLFGFFFTCVQLFEYDRATFTIADGIYGSTFYMLTGFHGLHVFIGSLFIFVCLLRTVYGHFSNSHHVGFECSAWYWHFVDVVWLFLFFFVYVWGSWGV